MINYKSESASKIVYLDQMCWIDIARMYYGKSSVLERKFLESIIKASDTGKIIFPLSVAHLIETNRIADQKRKDKLTSLMVRLSKGYSFQPYIDFIISEEIHNLILATLGLKTIDIRSRILKRGWTNILGGATLEWPKSKDGQEVPENIKKEMQDFLESDKVMEFVLKQPPLKSLLASGKEHTKIIEQMRAGYSNIKDNDLKRRIYFAKNISAIIVPKLADILYKSGLPPDFILKKNSKIEDIEWLLDNIPTARCWFTLLYQRDQQLQRPIHEHDLNDIWFLTLAIPYSDIVITEKMWKSISKNAKLDMKYNTTIISSINELSLYL